MPKDIYLCQNNYFKLIIQKIVSKQKIILYKIFHNKKQLNINNDFLFL